ncbi:MAG: histidine phosphatase family protein [Planctomycetes bacterium]|nr:histidine phosphatase family protein [Planctomycetota bacterium]
MTPPSPARPHPGFGTGAELWFFRHGEVHPDWHGRAYGGMDVPLSDRGVADTEERVHAFGALPFRNVVSSNLVRARALGEGLARKTGAELEITPALAEIQRGEWAGQSIAKLHATRPAEVAAYFADPWNFVVPKAESDRDVFARAWPAVERTVLAPRGGLVAVTAHYNVIRVLVAYLLGVAPCDSFCLRVDLASAVALRDDVGGWKLLRSNVRTPEGSRA